LEPIPGFWIIRFGQMEVGGYLIVSWIVRAPDDAQCAIRASVRRFVVFVPGGMQ
jgi:hypothetical protein